MERTIHPPRPAEPRRRPVFSLSHLVGLGVVLLAGSITVAVLTLHPSSRADGPSSANGKGDRRAVAVAFVDVEGGVRPLYPTQPGRVVELPVGEGVEVNEGTLLLKVDDTLAKLLLAQAEIDAQAARKRLEQAELLIDQHQKKVKMQEAALEAAKAKKASAQAQLKKAERYRKDRLGVQAEDVTSAGKLVEEAEAGIRAEQAKLDVVKSLEPSGTVELAKLDVKAKQEQVAKARYGVKECGVFAPCKGKLLRTLASVGEVLGVNPRQPALWFCPSGERIVRAEVEQEFARRVAVGQKARIEDDATGGGEWRGKVTRVSDWYTQRRSILLEPLQFNDVRTMEVIIRLENDPKNPLKIGQRVRVMLDGTN
jgi:membrane fusion protein (multidrug efflux system)